MLTGRPPRREPKPERLPWGLGPEKAAAADRLSDAAIEVLSHAASPDGAVIGPGSPLIQSLLDEGFIEVVASGQHRGVAKITSRGLRACGHRARSRLLTVGKDRAP